MGFYQEFISTVFQVMDSESRIRNRVVALTSSLQGEGVSHVADTLAVELATQTQRGVLLVEAAALKNISVVDKNQVWKHCQDTQVDNLVTLKVAANESAVTALAGRGQATDWEVSPEFRVACLKALRWNFDYVLIDCPSLAVSSEATSWAPLIDGIAVVVEAGQTRRSQIQRSQQMIEMAGGNFLGYILNQRRYPVPQWLYRIL